jgi:hypothetical protein
MRNRVAAGRQVPEPSACSGCGGADEEKSYAVKEQAAFRLENLAHK